MNVRRTVRNQHVRLVDRAAEQFAAVRRPPEGWLVALRKALGMSGAEVAARMDVSRNAVYQAERNERDGAITLKQMQKLAEAMGGRFVYAVVPEGSVGDVIHAHAVRKADLLVRRASGHMALEQQSLPNAQIEQRIEDLADELAREVPPDFWRTP